MSPSPPEQVRLASDSEWTRELQVELRRVRAAATAARLEARAAEIELLLRKAATRAPTKAEAPNRAEARAKPEAPTAPPAARAPARFPPVERLPVDDWQELVQNAALWHDPAADLAVPFGSLSAAATEPAVEPATESASEPEWRPETPAKTGPAAEPATAPNHLREFAVPNSALAAELPTDVPSTLGDEPARLDVPSTLDGPAAVLHTSPTALEGGPDAGRESDEAPRRKRPAAWIISTLAHAAGLLLLAATTISITEPKDQIALQAATPRADEPKIKTVPLEQVDQPEETAPQTPLPLATAPNPLGQIAASEFEIEAPDMVALPSDSSASLNQLLSSASPLAEASPELNSRFFGVEGGGNHFVYLVDNSGSMASVARDGFDVARRELLESIAALRSDQRFYVIFFGEKTLRMRISDPSEPERRSVHATPQNKEALRRWAMGVTMQPGRWPEESLQFAFELRPDVIFLLTDGEMSQKVDPMIRQHNLVESLFDGPRPRSIIHTIGFYSRKGAEQMQQIAATNGGTYRFVPPPRKR